MVGIVLPQLTSDIPVLQLDGSRLAGHTNQEVTQFWRQISESQDGQSVATVEGAELFHDGEHYDLRERRLELQHLWAEEEMDWLECGKKDSLHLLKLSLLSQRNFGPVFGIYASVQLVSQCFTNKYGP